MPQSFGTNTFLIEWSSKWVDRINKAVESGHPPLAGVQLSIVKVMDETEAQSAGWGDCWVAVSLPLPMFLDVERKHLADAGALDLTHCISGYLLNRLPDDDDDEPEAEVHRLSDYQRHKD